MHNNSKETLLPVIVYILNYEKTIISCAQVHRSTCTKLFTNQTCVPLQKVTQVVLWFNFSFSNLAAIYKHVINHFNIHCLPIYFRQYIVGIFNSTKNVNLASKVKRNSTGCFVLPQSCQTVVVKKAQKMYTIRFHQKLQKDSYLIPKSSAFFSPCLWLLSQGVDFGRRQWLAIFVSRNRAPEYCQGSQKNIPDKGCICNLSCYHLEIILFHFKLNHFLGGNIPQSMMFYESTNSITYIQDTKIH